jgi:hypothetical protein
VFVFDAGVTVFVVDVLVVIVLVRVELWEVGGDPDADPDPVLVEDADPCVDGLADLVVL